MRTLTFYSVMIYNSLFFLVAFPIVFIVYYFAVSAVSSEKRKNIENICLLVVSYIVLAHEPGLWDSDCPTISNVLIWH